MEREKELVRKYELLKEKGRKLINVYNNNWEKMEKIRSEYQTLTGKDVSNRHEIK